MSTPAFADQTAATIVPGGPADGLAHDVITRLAKLRSLFVIAQGTVFALHERSVGGVVRQMYLAILGQMAVLLGFAYFFATHLR